MISFREVAVLDRNAQFYGVQPSTLMENAGRGVAEFVKESFDLKEKRVLIFCGLGNNGGDGFVTARYLAKECDVEIVLLDKEDKIKSYLARENYEKIRGKVGVTTDLSHLEHKICEADIVIDAMLGVGIAGKLKERYEQCVDAINASNKTVIAIDVPTGLGTPKAVKANFTVTFHDKKEGMSKKNCGKIVVKGIGIPEKAVRFTGPGELLYYPIPKRDSHKGDNGTVLIVGGGPYTGAPVLAGLSALRTGVDLVHLAVPESIFSIVASYSPNFIVHSLAGKMLTERNEKSLLDMTSKVDAVVIGCGLGDDEKTKRAVRRIIKICTKPLVIDADAIKAVSEELSVMKGKNCVITPHLGEFRLLTNTFPDDLNAIEREVKSTARALGITVLLKGRVDIISDGRNVKLNNFGNQAMSVGGTGDALAGVVGALLSKRVSPYNSARVGAFINSYAGDLAFEEKGYSMLATDLIEKIPEVLKRFMEDFSTHYVKLESELISTNLDKIS